MIEFVEPIAKWVAAIIEVMGILVIVSFSAYTLAYGAIEACKSRDFEAIYTRVRRRLGRGILLGLELLVAADIIHTVAVELTFTTVGVLAIIVLIRTFLSFTLDVELTGRWPWQECEKSRKASNNHSGAIVN
ncbi:DUF1622 domain-containing protein [Gilvimarinus algae]|uniref:DUF1622 domain-containing protein n=1 Tax=Gilvimarinus algae TaxID=3058037 RepID=A0ABT8TBX7_9GAMM|nr:DUF1622 domain-containing protein [Gilvimarinus sp. SDUM040014]MDO3381604.1 DUF1622 domain-containing protein [Gilvimarinus sp. SDUM040014]